MPSINSSHTPKSVWCLVDCNNFYATCEQLFRPDLRDRPIVVLSNNDGCVIARSSAAKKLGIPMGEAWFKVAPLLKRFDGVVFSANFALYGDISSRIMAILESLCPQCEQYSIDEAFLRLDGAMMRNLPEFCRNLRDTVRKWTGITVSVGVGATPTLAKAANRIAKRVEHFNGLFSLVREESVIDRWLAGMAVDEVWGIGKRLARKLASSGVRTALDLKNADDVWLRQALTVTGLRCAMELRGKVCSTTWENPAQTRKSILHSRSFGNRARCLEDLEEALATFTARCAERMRSMRLLASGICVGLRSSHYDGDYYSSSGSAHLSAPTSSTTVLTAHARKILAGIYTAGVAYAKASVMLFDLVREDRRQLNLFEPDNVSSRRLMEAVDQINQRYGKLSLRFGAMGLKRAEWHMRQQYRSPDYTTDWHELPVVQCSSA